MKTLGLLCGMTWQSTILYYEEINKHVQSRLGDAHTAPLLLHSFDSPPMMQLMSTGEWQKVAMVLCAAAQGLKDSGAHGILICANIPHKVAGEVEDQVGLPLLHIADFTSQTVVERGYTRVALLGTKAVMEEEFYKRRLQGEHGFEVLVPDQDAMEAFNKLIFGELSRGVVSEITKAFCVKVARTLVQKGAECVILGCTELQFVLKEGDVNVPLFDTIILHARGAAEWAMDETDKDR